MADLSIASPKFPSIQLRRWFWILFLLNILFIVGSKYYLKPLETSEIVKFEIAKDIEKAEGIVRAWNTPDSAKFDKAVEAIYLDYLFILLYVTGIAIACLYFSRLTNHDILQRAGRFFGFLIIVAGGCDVIENIAMWYSLNGYLNQWNVTVAYDMAVTKFSIIIVSLLFMMISLVFYFLRKVGNRYILPYRKSR